MLRILYTLAIAAPLALGCRSADRLEVRFVHASTLFPSDFDRVTLRIRDVARDTIVDQGTIAGDALDRPARVIDQTKMTDGRTYVLEVVATAPACTRRGRAVGRSLPFEHRDGNYAVAIQVGCADEFAKTRGEPSAGRLGHVLVTEASGGAVLLGGAAGVATPSFRPIDPVMLVERYDPATGNFVPAGSLSVQHVLGSGAALPSGSVAVFGGYSEVGCGSAVDLLTGSSSSNAGTLDPPRCFATAAYVPRLDRVLVAGGANSTPLNRQQDIELWPAAFDGAPIEVAGTAFRSGPAVVVLGDDLRAMIAGGTTNELRGPQVEMLEVGGSCGEGAACTRAIDGEMLPVNGWTQTAASWVPCAGTDGGGAVYVTGGDEASTLPMTPATTRSDVWCWREGMDRIEHVGSLPNARRGHRQVTVGGPSGSQRLLIAAGEIEETGAVPYSDAILVPADGCTCAIGTPESIPLGISALAYGMQATPLADGSVLVVGGATFDTTAGTVIGTSDSVLFVPDLGPPEGE